VPTPSRAWLAFTFAVLVTLTPLRALWANQGSVGLTYAGWLALIALAAVVTRGRR
jgi:hypothetical protein